jgi:hypothetical protein
MLVRIFSLVLVFAASLSTLHAQPSAHRDVRAVRHNVKVERRTYGDAQRYRWSAQEQLKKAFRKKDVDELKIVAVRFELTGDALLSSAERLTAEARNLMVASEQAFLARAISRKTYQSCQRYARNVLGDLDGTWVIKPENEIVTSIAEGVR